LRRDRTDSVIVTAATPAAAARPSSTGFAETDETIGSRMPLAM
jgi:hypothetical protein